MDKKQTEKKIKQLEEQINDLFVVLKWLIQSTQKNEEFVEWLKNVPDVPKQDQSSD